MKSLFLLSELQNWVYYFSMMRNSRINGKSMLDHNLFHAIKTNISLSFMFTNLQILLELDQTFWSVVRFMMLRSASFLCHFQTLHEFWILLIHFKPFKRTQMFPSSIMSWNSWEPWNYWFTKQDQYSCTKPWNNVQYRDSNLT